MEHAGTGHVRRVLVAAGDEIAGVDLGNGLAGDGPFVWRSDGIVGGKILRESFAASEFDVREGTAGGGIGDFGVGGDELFGRDVPFLGGDVDEDLARGIGDAAELRRHGGSGAAAEGAGVEGSQSAVSAMTMRTDSKGTRSSSATVCASSVRMF